jgi:O-antigen/teichoic acid export membrane protein
MQSASGTPSAAEPEKDHGPARVVARRIGAKAIRRGLVINVLGALLPAVVALFCIRQILGGLGHARFGVLSLAWTFINAIGILDLGLGRALTRFLAVHEERDPAHEASILWTSLAAIAGLGVCGGLAAWAGANALGANLAHGDATLQAETAWTLRILSLSVPLVVLSSGLRGILEAFGRFDLTNRVSVPISLLNLLVPVILLRLGASLPGIVSALVVLRLASTLLFLRSALDVVPAMRVPRLSSSGMRSVLAFAGWTTVSNIPGPLFAQAERFFLGSFMALAAVGYYSTPADLLSRVTIIPAAVVQVMFPVLAQAVLSDRVSAGRLAGRGLLLIAAAVLPAVTLLVAIAPEGLQLWLGPEFAAHAIRPGRIVALAMFVNCMAWLPFSLIQSAGRADWPGKLHAVEMPVHLMLTAVLIHAAGVDGAALANLLRAAVDAGLVIWMATRVLGRDRRLARHYVAFVLMGVVTMAGAAAPVSLAGRLVWSFVSLSVAAVATWRVLLDEADRQALSAEVMTVWTRIRSSAG